MSDVHAIQEMFDFLGKGPAAIVKAKASTGTVGEVLAFMPMVPAGIKALRDAKDIKAELSGLSQDEQQALLEQAVQIGFAYAEVLFGLSLPLAE